MSVNSYDLEIASFSQFGIVSNPFETVRFRSIQYDDLSIDGHIPRFSVVLNNSSGAAATKWNSSDVVRIRKNRAIVFIGSIDTKTPEKNLDGSSILTLEGMHYYYRRLLDTFANPSSEFEDGNRFNVWQFGRRLDTANELTDGINPSDIVKMMTGNVMIIQEFFDNLDKIENNDWIRNADDFTDVTSTRSLENFSLTENWVQMRSSKQQANFYSTGVNHNAFVVSVDETNNQGDVRLGVGDPVNNFEGAGFFQDNVTLNPGDILKFSIKSPIGVENRFRAQVLVFENGTFNHPNDASTDEGLVVGTRQGNITTLGGVLGGPADVQSSDTYRVGVIFTWIDPSSASISTQADLVVETPQVLAGSGFDSLSMVDGKLQLKQVSGGANQGERFATAGTAKSIKFFLGNPNIQRLPNIKGEATVKITGSKYKTFDPTFELSRDGGSTYSTVSLSFDGTDTWTGTHDFGSVVDGENELRVRIGLTSDGEGTTRLDYYRTDVFVENYTREIKIDGGQQVYREDITGISSDISEIDTYTFPSSIEGDAVRRAKLETFAMEFFQDSLLEGVFNVVESTIKREFLDSTFFNHLPAGKTVAVQDANWDFRINNKGKVLFKEHIGEYFGKNAGPLTKEYSFRQSRLKLITKKEVSNDIINNLIYIGKGVAGLSTLILDGNAFQDQASINKYGMRVGRVTEKRNFDAFAAINRANAILREKRSPVVHLTVELAPDFDDDWNVGDIIFIKDGDAKISDDFRVLKKTTDVSAGGENITVELSTKNKTIKTAFQGNARQTKALSLTDQGANNIVTGATGSPKFVSRTSPYILPVDIPADAKSTLDTVFLNLQTEPAFRFTDDFIVKYLSDSDGKLLFPTNVRMSLNDFAGVGRAGIPENSGPYLPFPRTGVLETGDLHEVEDDKDSIISQDIGVGFLIELLDISDAFKDSTGKWITGRHYVFFHAQGNDHKQVNQDNVGFMQGGITLKRASEGNTFE